MQYAKSGGPKIQSKSTCPQINNPQYQLAVAVTTTLPPSLAGLHIVGVDEAADRKLAAGNADNHRVFHDERRAGAGVTLRVVRHGDVPDHLACRPVERHQVSIERGHERAERNGGEDGPGGARHRAGFAHRAHDSTRGRPSGRGGGRVCLGALPSVVLLCSAPSREATMFPIPRRALAVRRMKEIA